MSRLMPFEGLLKNLRQEIPPERKRLYLSKEKACEMLKEWSGQDFGYDVSSWEIWIKEHGDSVFKRKTD